MNLLLYKSFRYDAEKYLKESIEKFNLKLNVDLNLQRKESINEFFFFENPYYCMSINYIETFPFQDVVPHFYLLDSTNTLIEISDKYLRPFLKLMKKNLKIIVYHNTITVIGFQTILKIMTKEEFTMGYIRLMI